jgi:hypothetical protein
MTLDAAAACRLFLSAMNKAIACAALLPTRVGTGVAAMTIAITTTTTTTTHSGVRARVLI